jgi:branched-chain amino acid transport system permease protein
MVAAAADHGAKAAAATVAAAIKDASGTALLALGLSFPILALRTEQNMANQLVLDERWGYVGVAVLLAFLARLVYLLRTAFAAPRLPRPVSPGIARSPYVRGAMLAGIVLLLAYPFLVLGLVGRFGAIKWIDNFAIQILIYVMLGWGLNIVVGLAGLLDLGYVAFYAIGAYAFALLSQHYDLGFWTCLPLAGILAAFWGILLGFPVLRLRGDYLAIVTLAFGEIIRLVAVNWVDLTRGYAGLSGVPRATFFGLPFDDSEHGFAAVFGLEFSSIHRTIFFFYLILAMAAITNWVTLRLRRLPVGRAWEALREDETACRSLGINTTNTKLTAFALGALFGGLAGAFYVTSRGQGFVTPESFTFMESALILAIVVLGGLGSQLGVAIAAVVLIGGTELLRELDWMKQIFGRDFEPTHYRMLLFGLAMVLVMIWKPRGVISTRMPSIFLRERRVVRGDLVGEGHG